MQHKRGNPHKQAKRRKKPLSVLIPPLDVARLTLHDVDPITGQEELLYALFYEYYRGYTIYSNERDACCIHGCNGGCLRIRGKYACFPSTEEAKNLIKHFLADGRTAQEPMSRYVPEQAYLCLDERQRRPHRVSSRWSA